MKYYESTEQINVIGSFITFRNGYYSFELDEGEVLALDEIDKNVLEKYDLKSSKFEGKLFKITYSIIIDDMDDEDFIILRLDNLELIQK